MIFKKNVIILVFSIWIKTDDDQNNLPISQTNITIEKIKQLSLFWLYINSYKIIRYFFSDLRQSICFKM